MTLVDKWIPVSVRLPKDGERVQWMAPGGEVVSGKKGPGKLWFEGGMYIYYEPLFWKPEARDE